MAFMEDWSSLMFNGLYDITVYFVCDARKTSLPLLFACENCPFASWIKAVGNFPDARTIGKYEKLYLSGD